jgi:hypothetical protein
MGVARGVAGNKSGSIAQRESGTAVELTKTLEYQPKFQKKSRFLILAAQTFLQTFYFLLIDIASIWGV